jgi:hypothetical protein
LWKKVPLRIDFFHLFISEERTNLLSYVIALFPIIRLYHGTDLNWRQLIIRKYHSPPFFRSAKLVDNLVGQPKVSIDFSFEVLKWEIKADLRTLCIGVVCLVIRTAPLPEFDSRRRNNFFFLKSCIESNLEIRLRRSNMAKCWFVVECDISPKRTCQHNPQHAKCYCCCYRCCFQRKIPMRTRTVSMKTLRNFIKSFISAARIWGILVCKIYREI